MKPKQILVKLLAASRDRYKDQDIDTRDIASLLNLVMTIGDILDEQEDRIAAFEENE